MSKYNVGLKTLLQGLSEPEFYGDLVYKFRKIIGKNDFLIISKMLFHFYTDFTALLREFRYIEPIVKQR